MGPGLVISKVGLLPLSLLNRAEGTIATPFPSLSPTLPRLHCWKSYLGWMDMPVSLMDQTSRRQRRRELEAAGIGEAASHAWCDWTTRGGVHDCLRIVMVNPDGLTGDIFMYVSFGSASRPAR
ncbi:hypothetical protein IW261DRAFT_1499927 [Armillaria novae-zelandiae]|uniref:Uncharacterized protein n=1 Tax=Armillaria novae-zelandiae TaxID=153914 RepID=A0AA39NYJ9_9AGAR|nr:hypothetical protein IW261DRAFT_1499927 [Armillaria novae-zelandiae]